MPCPIVFFDVAGADTESLKAFYSSVFGWDSGEQGQLTVPVVSPLDGTIRKDPTEMRIYIGVPDVSESLELVKAHGGSVDAPRMEVAGVVVLGLFKDPAGNSLGLVEMDGESLKVP